MWHNPMWNNPMWEGHWMMGWGLIPMLIFWGLVLLLFFYLIKSLFGSGSSKPGDPGDADNSLSILKERLARGEIDEAEFNALYQKLRHVG